MVSIVGGSFRGSFSILCYSLASGRTMSHSPRKSAWNSKAMNHVVYKSCPERIGSPALAESVESIPNAL
jgi:hypothetical protein